VAREFAQLIGYPDPEQTYLAGLLHDLGIIVNSLVCTEQYRKVIDAATDAGCALDEVELNQLGFTHCESGKILAEMWNIPAPVVEVIEFHHQVDAAPENSLVALIHLTDLLCRMRGLGYGYDEWRAVDLTADPAWKVLSATCPRLRLGTVDIARFTMDLDGVVEKVSELVDAVFAPAAKVNR
jgi:HD-like signal output (HDOD) protein